MLVIVQPCASPFKPLPHQTSPRHYLVHFFAKLITRISPLFDIGKPIQIRADSEQTHALKCYQQIQPLHESLKSQQPPLGFTLSNEHHKSIDRRPIYQNPLETSQYGVPRITKRFIIAKNMPHALHAPIFSVSQALTRIARAKIPQMMARVTLSWGHVSSSKVNCHINLSTTI